MQMLSKVMYSHSQLTHQNMLLLNDRPNPFLLFLSLTLFKKISTFLLMIDSVTVLY